MSRRNPSSRSASSPKVEEKVCISFSSCPRPGKGLFSSSRHLKPISLAKDLRQVLKPEKVVLGMLPTSLNAASNITHSAIVFTSDDDIQCALYSSIVHCEVEDFNVKFCESRATQSPCYAVPYCACDVTCRSSMELGRYGTPQTGLTFCLNMYDQYFRSQRWARF